MPCSVPVSFSHMRGCRECEQKLPLHQTMGGGDTANLEKGVCAWVWATESERWRGSTLPTRKKMTEPALRRLQAR